MRVIVEMNQAVCAGPFIYAFLDEVRIVSTSNVRQTFALCAPEV